MQSFKDNLLFQRKFALNFLKGLFIAKISDPSK